jgi:hypothetical protein
MRIILQPPPMQHLHPNRDQVGPPVSQRSSSARVSFRVLSAKARNVRMPSIHTEGPLSYSKIS